MKRTPVNLTDRAPFVVVAGIPGAGKTTALQHLKLHHPLHTPRVVDSESVRRSLQARLPGVPYRILRPLVHLAHWARIAVLALTEARVLLVHETATRWSSRTALLWIARLARRPARMVWIDVDVESARQGQIDRARVIRSASFRRHLHRISRCDPPAAASRTWDTVYRTDRDKAVQAILVISETKVSSLPHRPVSEPVGEPPV